MAKKRVGQLKTFEEPISQDKITVFRSVINLKNLRSKIKSARAPYKVVHIKGDNAFATDGGAIAFQNLKGSNIVDGSYDFKEAKTGQDRHVDFEPLPSDPSVFVHPTLGNVKKVETESVENSELFLKKTGKYKNIKLCANRLIALLKSITEASKDVEFNEIEVEVPQNGDGGIYITGNRGYGLILPLVDGATDEDYKDEFVPTDDLERR